MGNMTKLLAYSLGVLLIGIFASPTLAQQKAAPKESVMKRPAFMTEAEFLAKTQLFKGEPNNDSALAYEVRLPKDWVKEASSGVADAKDITTLNQKVIQRVARYVSPAKKHRRSFMTVESQELSYEIGIRNWFLNYVEDTGITLETITKTDDKADYVEASYIAVDGDVSYGVRVKAILNGPNIVMARYYVPIELFQDGKVLQAQGIASFHLVGEKLSEIEERRTHGFLDQAYFDFPISWTLTAPKVINVERMRAMIYTPTANKKLSGQINIYATSRFIDTSMGKEVNEYREKFSLPGYGIGPKIESLTLPVQKDISKSVTEAYDLKPQKATMAGYELWVTAMESEGFIFIVTMITPSRTEEFYRWARNVKAYEIVVATTRQFDESIDRYQFSE